MLSESSHTKRTPPALFHLRRVLENEQHSDIKLSSGSGWTVGRDESEGFLRKAGKLLCDRLSLER